MKAEKILFPTDFSECSQRALAQATSLARDSGATLLIVHCEEPPATYAAAGLFFTLPGADVDSVREALAGVKPDDPAVACEHWMLSGSPADAILECAERENVDLIVLGTHGRTGLSRLLMGSVAEEIVRRSPCPVISVRPSPEHLPASD